MENLIKMDDLGVPLFPETSILFNLLLYVTIENSSKSGEARNTSSVYTWLHRKSQWLFMVWKPRLFDDWGNKF